MNKLAEKIYPDFYKGLYFYSKEKKIEDERRDNKENGKIQDPDSRNLHNLFVTAIEHYDEEELQIQTVNKSKYAHLVNKYALRGIQIETKKVGVFEYEYTIHIKTKTLLGELEKFRRP